MVSVFRHWLIEAVTRALHLLCDPRILVCVLAPGIFAYEALMAHRGASESWRAGVLFAGNVVVLGGDFRQVHSQWSTARRALPR